MTLRFSLTYFIIFLISVPAFSQTQQDPILLEIADNKVRLSEFEAVYKKNNQQVSKTSIDEYLDLYIKFKLKVMEAEDLGLDTIEKFKRELSGYRKQLSEPYLSDNEVTSALIKEAYERLKYEIKASHILVSMERGISPADTLKAYRKAEEIMKRIQKGEEFAKVAKEVSDDPSAKDNAGNLGYFSAMYMIYPFETAVYKAEVGKVSPPVRSEFGYHLILVEDKRPNRGEITTAHIMTRTQPEATEAEIEAASMKINEIYEKLQQGANFEELAGEFSEDKGSSNKGGLIAPFRVGRMFPEYEDAAFALKNDGDYSKPLRSKVGFHIVKRVSLKLIGSLEEEQHDLKVRIARDSRSKMSKTSFMNRIKKEYGFKETIARRNDFYKAIDSSYFQKKWSAENVAHLKGEMFRLGDSIVYQKHFARYLERNQPRGGGANNVPLFIDAYYDRFVEEFITNYEDVRLDSKYPEFRMLMQEYHDGILLFDLTDEKVWTKAVKDSAGLASYYEAHKSENMWPERAQAVVYCASDEAMAAKTKKMVKERKKKSYGDNDILQAINSDSQLNLEMERSKFSKGDNEVVDQVSWKPGISANIQKGSRVCFAEIEAILQPEPKALDEVKGMMTSGYQNQLEEEWVKALKEKYTIKINREYLSLIK